MSPMNYSVTSLKKLESKTCAEVLCEYLELEGVEYVFGVSGGTIISILEALEKSDKIKFIMTKHEGGASFMADMYARVSGKIGVCLSTAGPGATNMLTGVACAQQDRVPLLAITGQPATHTIGKGAVQESSEFGVHTVGIYGQFTGASITITDPKVFQQILTRTLRIAQSEYKQAVHISIPSNVSSAVYESLDIHTETRQYRVSHTALDSVQIKKAAMLLYEAKNPAILVGSGSTQHSSINDLIKIAELISCPVATTPKGKGIFPESHPLSLGVFGFAGNLCAKSYLLDNTIDLLLVIASRLGEWTTESWDPRLLPSHYLIQIDVDSRNIGQNFPVSLGIVGDIDLAVKELLSQLSHLHKASTRKGTLISHADFAHRFDNINCLKTNVSRHQQPDKMFSDAIPIKPQRLMRDLNLCLQKDAIVLADAGNSYAWAIHYCEINPPQQFIIGLGFASMGHAAAGVVGAALSAPDRQVIAIVGDGAMLMNGNELHTAVEYKVPAIWLVLNDSGWGMVYHGNRAVTGQGIASRFHAVNFADMASVLGARGYRVTRPGELTEIMPKIIKERLPAVIDAVIDPEEEPPFLERVRAVQRYMNRAL